MPIIGWPKVVGRDHISASVRSWLATSLSVVQPMASAAVRIQLAVYLFKLSSHTAKLRPNLIHRLEVPTQPQPQLRQSYETRSHHDTLMIAVMKHCSHERFTSAQIVSIIVANSRWFPKHILPFSPAKCVLSFCPNDDTGDLYIHTWMRSDSKVPNGVFLANKQLFLHSVFPPEMHRVCPWGPSSVKCVERIQRNNTALNVF